VPQKPAGVPGHALTIVGIGGSAGSLSPLREFFLSLPADSGMAFVVVSHQAPSGRSLLPEILSKTTQMPVCEISDSTQVAANHVYVAPRGRNVAIRGGVLRLERMTERGRPPLPIDFFFRALAEDQAGRAVGIVLSGTGTDGTLGLAEIRAEGGLSLVQAPETAEFDGMPASAIAAQAADFVLAIDEMSPRLRAHVHDAVAMGRRREVSAATSRELEQILALIRLRGGHDFSAYKRQTLLRRIHRRMDLHRIEGLADYARYLEENDSEIDALWRDWLIGVTRFFRDPESLEELIHSGFSKVLATRDEGSPLRIWVPGCATGEEAYSIAMLLQETLEQLGKRLALKVFATDLDPTAIQTARAGRYPEGIGADVGARRLARFFVREDGHYRVKKLLRDAVVFAVQDVLQDPPFTRMDLISCRNLLIYFTTSAQQSLLPVFHYSLNPGGLLLLGAGETISGSENLFSTLDKRWKLFRRNDFPRIDPPLRFTERPVRAANPASPARGGLSAGRAPPDLSELLQRHLAARFGPPAVVIDLAGEVQQIHGQVGDFLELPPGRANLNILKMARDGVGALLVSALRELRKSDGPRVERNARLEKQAGKPSLHLVVERIDDASLERPLLLVSFETLSLGSRPGARGRPRSSRAGGSDPRARLEDVLHDTRRDLQGAVDELQSANQELASANEEVQSVNEELQSSNEELETSKEETLSLNEELHSVNAELTQKLEAFEHANDDLLNLIHSIEVATIFLDEHLCVKRFTPEARSVARLIDTDIGRPLSDLALIIDYPGLLSDADAVLRSLEPSAKQVSAPDGSWYDVRIRPYRTTRNAVEGLVITLIDVTETKRGERVQAARLLAESIVDAVREPLLVLDGRLHVVRGNRSFYRLFQVESADTDGRSIDDLGSRQWDAPRLRELLEKTLHEGTVFDDFEVEYEFPSIGKRRMRLNARPVFLHDAGVAALLVLGIEDVTAVHS
jgi:two-component system CheB/CheR fusion protein